MDITPASSYQPPVDKLLTYATADVVEAKDWPNYLELGLTSEHIPALIRMATDKELSKADSHSLEFWAPTHAWRALGQLRAIEAVEPLLTLFDISDDSEWVAEEVPEVFDLIGPAALPTLEAYLADSTHKEWSRINAASGVVNIGLDWPDMRSTSVAILGTLLEHASSDESEFSAFLISDLLGLEAKEAAPIIEQAFAEDRVDIGIVGDWNRVQFDLGLLSAEEFAKRDADSRPSVLMPISSYTTSPSRASGSRQSTSKKSKNKMAKQSRKKNRKR